MKQLVLDIRPDAPPTLDNFVAGANGELVAVLRELAGAPDETGQIPRLVPATHPGHLYLWGDSGSGRSHLLRAAVAAVRDAGKPAERIAATDVIGDLPDTPGLLAVDDVETLDDAAQIALFNAFNRARANAQTLLLSGRRAPRDLALREDLRTRIGQCLIYEVRPLDDAARAAILTTLAERRGLPLSTDVTDFLLRHGRRDLASLLRVLDALDAASLERKRPITLPLLREMMQSGLDI